MSQPPESANPVQEASRLGLNPGLHVVSTPIGNMGDMTQRAIKTLAEVDMVACEDTRRTGLLLKKLGIANRLVSYHEHNKLRRTPEIIEMLRRRKTVALVADAGTPGISDPGFYLIRAVVREGLNVEPVPGASALLAGLVVSGLPSNRFAFEGFLPKRSGRRLKQLAALKKEPRTLVFFEPARRVARFLSELLNVVGDRNVVVARELTKKHQEVLRGRVSEVLVQIAGRALRGETVVVLEGAVAGHGTEETVTE